MKLIRNSKLPNKKAILFVKVFIDMVKNNVRKIYETSDILMYALLKNMPAVKKNSRHIRDKL